jgi:H+/Cl- antiporter ClcA
VTNPTNPTSTDVVLTPKVIGLSLAIGVVGAFFGFMFLEIATGGQRILFTELPQHFGFDQAPWWWITAVLLVGALVVFLAHKLPGQAGDGPLLGFHFDEPPRKAAGILLAAFGTLMFGFVLGPEAPIIILGTTIGALMVRKQQPSVVTLAMFLGGLAAIGTVFGNPFITIFMVLEFVAVGAAPAAILLPGLIALGAGFLVQTGLGNVPGLGVHSLSVPGMPDYTSITAWDLVLGVAVAITTAILVGIFRLLALKVAAFASKQPTALIFGSAIVTAILAIFLTEVFDLNPNLLLFSGQSGMPDLITQTSVGTVIAIFVAKAIAYSFALGGGFRGGPIFPATFLGVAVGVLAILFFPETNLSPMAAAGIAAAAAVMLRLPFTSAILALLLVSAGGAYVAPFAIIGAITGYLVRVQMDQRLTQHAQHTLKTVTNQDRA